MRKIIKQKVSIDSKYLDKNIRSHILTKLKKHLEGTCTKENGYILRVNRITDLGENIISPETFRVVFNVKYEVDLLKPVEGLEISGIVCMVFRQGILVNINDIMQVLVPHSNMEGYLFNDICFSSDGYDISEKDVVSIRITKFKYEENKFSCIGCLV